MFQASYINKVLEWFLIQNSKNGLRVTCHAISFSKKQCPQTPQEEEDMRQIPYASIVRTLMYAILWTRLDIYYAVGVVSQFQSYTSLDHWIVVKYVLRYLRKTRDCMLVYSCRDLSILGYTNSDFQGDKDSRKSTSRSVFTFSGAAVV